MEGSPVHPLDESSLGDTAELGPLDAEFAAAAAAAAPPRVSLDYAAASHQGHIRPRNEDHYLVARFGRFLEPLLTSIPAERAPATFQEEGLGMVVADGMGGAAAGDVASEFAIRTLLDLVCAMPEWIMGNSPGDVERSLQRFAELYRHVDAALKEHAASHSELWGMGTTLTLVSSLGNALTIAHIGDSRVYLLRAGQLHRLTHDHTVAQEMVDLGVTHEQEITNRLRHSLTRALGGTTRFSEADVDRCTLQDGDKVLLCSDGLTGMVSDGAIKSILQESADAEEACQRLIAAALDNGGRDNVTVVVAAYRIE
jgi:protein phosphatase